MDFELLKTKNAVKLGWNSESKKFIKSSEFKDAKLFDIIKNTNEDKETVVKLGETIGKKYSREVK